MVAESAIFDIPVFSTDGQETTLKPYAGKVLLIVNVASKCGFTKQYTELEVMYRDFQSRGFVVLGFPCNQFMQQEPKSNQEIKEFASSCFNVTFPLFAKLDVKGTSQAPLYAYLSEHLEKKPWKFVPWNFTKIIVDREGRVLRQFLPVAPMKKVRKAVEALL